MLTLGWAIPLAVGLVGATAAPQPVAVARTPTPLEAAMLEDERELGPTPGNEDVRFAVVLVQPGSEALREFLAGTRQPGSPDYRRRLTPAEFGARFGLPDADLAEVEAWLADHGFRVVDRPIQRTSLGVEGRVRRLNEVFRTRLMDGIDAAGHRYHVPAREPTVPRALRRHVAAIGGLDTRRLEPKHVAAPIAAIRGGMLRPADTARAFEIEGLHAAGTHGEGQQIGIVSFDTFLDSDIADFDRLAEIAELAGGTPPPVTRHRLEGAAERPGGGSDEVVLDIEVVRSIAPMAQIVNYEGPNTGSFAPIMRAIIDDAQVDIVSISWGLCEANVAPANRLADDREFDVAFAAGISVFVASGDHGAFGCRFSGRGRDSDMRLSVDYPSANPGLISVGGTYLSVRTDGSWLDETGWEDAMSGWATGGGLSDTYPRPEFQRGPGVDNRESDGRRQVPDVAGPADSDSGFMVVYTPPGEEQTVYPGGGTSASAPFFAAAMVLARQLAEDAGVGTDGIGRMGALGPLLYDLSIDAPAGSLFHDVLRGGNLRHNATPGWDYATGLGTPRVEPLARAIVDALR